MSSSTHNVDTSSSTHPKSTKSNNPKSKKKRQSTEEQPGFCSRLCNAVDESIEKAEKKRMERTGPKPWIERKFIVGVVIALFAWSSYDFLGQILRKCLLRRDDALVGFASGIVLTIFYCIFWIMFTITYLKLIFTSPGFARDHVPKSEPPLPSDPPPELNLNKTNNNATNAGTYPPSIRVSASDYRRSMEERITHNSISIDDHGEFDSPTVPRTEADSEADGSTTIGVPYSSMGPRRHKRSESGSNIAIPPTPRFPDTRTSTSSSPITPTTPKQPAPALLRKNSKSSNPPSPSEQKPPNKLIRLSSSSRNTTSSVPASPGIPTFTNTRKSESSREGAGTPAGGRRGGRPEALKAASGFRFDSTSTMDRTRVHSRTHSQSGTVNIYPPTTLPTPSMSAPQTPSTSTPVPGIRLDASANHPTVNLAGRTEPDDDMTEIRRDAGEDLEEGRPSVYLDDLPPVQDKWQRRPSDQPVLDPYYRYCTRDGIIKPMRAHHCRICNTCVLGYDHHCPWVGQCVGARNRRFFVVFLFWSSLYTLYTFGLLIATIVHELHPHSKQGTASTPSGTVDGNLIALVIVTALFMLFTTGMFATHVHLLSRNASTVEWHGIQGMRERERAVISQAVPVCGCLGMDGEGNGGLLGTAEEGGGKNPWQEEGLKGYKGRVALRKRFDEEWGRVGKEGNLWWLGSSRANWDAVMGRNPWTWFLPFGDTSNIGLVYPTNPRFDEHGRWMRRREWPAELQ